MNTIDLLDDARALQDFWVGADGVRVSLVALRFSGGATPRVMRDVNRTLLTGFGDEAQFIAATCSCL